MPGPYNPDPSQLLPGQITSTPARVLRKVGIRVLAIHGIRGARRRGGPRK